jgi:Ca2+-binding RTX toxin-like protein
MALVSAGSALNMGALAMGRIADGVVNISSPSLVSVDQGGARYNEFSGEFLYSLAPASATLVASDVAAGQGGDVYDGKIQHHEGHEHGTYPSGGMISRIQEYANGALVMDAQGLSANASVVFSVLRAGNIMAALNFLFDSDDSITGSAFADSLMGAGGADELSGGAGSDSLDGNAGGDTLLGGEGDDFIRGLEDNDNIDGGGGGDDVNGNTGADIVHGGDGVDFVRGGQGDDTVYGDAGDDVHVNGNIGADRVFGGDGNDTVFGGQNNDSLYGEAGNDWLSGDLGDDVLTGGAGADRFIIRAGGGLDRAMDFNSAEGDRVQLAAGTGYTLTTVAGQVVVDLGGGAQLALTGVTMATLGDWLVFA